MNRTAVPSQSSSRMKLGAVSHGRLKRPLRVLLYGVEGVGKSTFAASAPSPVFLAAEEGTAQLDVARFPEPLSWTEAFEALSELTEGEHSFQTLVIDTLDWLEPLCWQAVCERLRLRSIEDAGYGRGYVAALEEWRTLLVRLDALRLKRGMHIVLLAHSAIRTFKNPEDADYDRYELKVHQKAAALLKEWSDAVLFARYETFTHADEKTKRTRGVSTGARVLHTQHAAAWDAKNRFDLPPALPLEWQAFAEAVAAHRPAAPERLRERIAALLERADEPLRQKVSAAVQAAGDNAALLAKYADTLEARINLNQEKS